MSDFWQELIISWGGNAILVGLIAYIGKIYLERISREEQAAIDERIKRLEQDHEKLVNRDEYFHQVTAETYQEILKKKIRVYDELTRLKSLYINHTSIITSLRNNKDFQNEKYYDSSKGLECYSLLLEMYAYTIKNQLYISTQLLEKFNEWMKKKNDLHAQYISETLPNIDEENIENYVGDNLRATMIEFDGRSTYILEETINKIFAQIDEDIKFVKDKHGF
ncbi:hypothetical protein [Psychrobacter glaciei]|uniref:hypothetical protein n=1 Tax=Psychrobacter glaciei TaxID=619771 RepID=UPI001F05EB84|nr:hypothetical protein [Psychrobacter glaciei]MCH1783314.1 hypothetical protein [Psychrobacter glaciei]